MEENKNMETNENIETSENLPEESGEERKEAAAAEEAPASEAAAEGAAEAVEAAAEAASEEAASGEAEKAADAGSTYDDSHGFWEEQAEFSREQWILTHIGEENLLEYLKMEQKREDDRQKSKDLRQKNILSAFQLTVSLAAVIAIIFLLKDNPTVMVNILYIIAIIAALWIWKNPKSKQE